VGILCRRATKCINAIWRLKRTFYPVNILSKDANYGDTGSVAFQLINIINCHDLLVSSK
jgi:hypothetical protein